MPNTATQCKPTGDNSSPTNKTKHLHVTESGFVWLHSLRPDATLLDSESCLSITHPRWPSALLGEEPEWFWPEVERLQAWWQEERRIEEEEAIAEMARMDAEYYAGCSSFPWRA